MNNRFKNLSRIEFVVTYGCTGKCIHCSQGNQSLTNKILSKDTLPSVIHELSRKYNITSVMTFGGEPLLYPDVVCTIHSAAKESSIPHRQLITNGFFSSDFSKIKDVAYKLSVCGVNDILLSVDAFHQETIPLEPVKAFALYTKEYGAKIRTSPAWLVSRDDNNPYNLKTRKILEEFEALGIGQADGNVIFPSGNALRFLGEYFEKDKEYINPYDENPDDIRSISIEPDGTLLCGNIYTDSVTEILQNFK